MDGDDDGGRGLYAWKEKFLLLRGREGGGDGFRSLHSRPLSSTLTPK